MSKIVHSIIKDIKSIPEKVMAKLKGVEIKKLLLINFPYLLFAYAFNKISWLYHISTKETIFNKVLYMINNIQIAFTNPLPSIVPKDVIIGVIGGFAVKLIVYYKAKNAKKFRHGREYGSARWGNKKDIEPYVDAVFENNIILTETERLMMSGRPKEPKYSCNRWFWLWKDKIFCKTKPYANAQLLCSYRPKRNSACRVR